MTDSIKPVRIRIDPSAGLDGVFYSNQKRRGWLRQWSVVCSTAEEIWVIPISQSDAKSFSYKARPSAGFIVLKQKKKRGRR